MPLINYIHLPLGSCSALLTTDLYDASDAAKKRRKQTTPLRLAAEKGSIAADSVAQCSDMGNDQEICASEGSGGDGGVDKLRMIETNLLLQQNMDGGLLDNLDIVQRAALLISQLQRPQKCSDLPQDQIEGLPTDLSMGQNNDDESDGESQKGQTQMANLKLLMSEIMDNKDCGECGSKFDSNLKLKMHIFQEHGHSVMRYRNPEEGHEEMGKFVDETEPNKLQMMGANQHPMSVSGKHDDWMALAGLPFPFPHDGSSFVPQLPLLNGLSAVQMGQFVGNGGSSMDSLSRPGPPLRIFNPEAYCDLCNKEFCNKYFLKTHRANKHGIYENSSSASDSSTSNSATTSLPQQSTQGSNIQQPSMMISTTPNCPPHPLSEASTTGTGGNMIPGDMVAVHCDICMKKFANTFAMKRHRTKAHETLLSGDKVDQNPTLNSQAAPLEADRSNVAIRFPDDFRPDFSVEQEDASFTPQPRKLSPVSIQQARESNFSVDKLKRLGVLNPDAFCEICCKEYCNKYFLRTHKLKRHGILMPPDEAKDVSADRNPWQFMQANPINLMIGDFHPIRQLQQKFLHEMTDMASRGKSPVTNEEKQKMEMSDEKTSTKKQSEDKGSAIDSPSISPSAEQQTDVDAISMDLQKLQSMILQLNDLNANSSQLISCHWCGKELENQYLFHAHLMAEHGHMSEGPMNLKPKSGSESPTSPKPSISQLQQQLMNAALKANEFCKQCDKDFANPTEFKQHLFEVHGLVQRSGSVSPPREGFLTPDRPTTNNNNGSFPATPTGERRPPYSMTPTSSYCEICNKELCNKYFMKTHMQRMHGIEIENGSQIGGVVCNICNKELCSKYFLRVHKHNTHGIIEDGAPLPPQIAAKINGEAAAAAAAAAATSMSTGETNADQNEGKVIDYTCRRNENI